MTQLLPRPFDMTMSEQARDDVTRWPDLVGQTDNVILRASARLVEMLEMGQNVAADVHGHQEALTVRVGLFPPRDIRIEQIMPGAVMPEGAIEV